MSNISELPRFNPRNFQTKIIQDVLKGDKKKFAISVCRRGGKDFIALAIADILAQMNPGINIGYLGVSLKSLRKILFSNDESGIPMYKSVIDYENVLKRPKAGVDYFFRETSSFQYKNGSCIYLLGTDSDAELGTSMKLLIVTEAGRIPFESWVYLVPSLESSDGYILQVSTPFFGSEFNDLLNGEHRQSTEYNKYIIPATELYNSDGTRVYEDDKLERIRRSMDKATFEQEYMCNTKAINKTSVLGYSLENSMKQVIPDINSSSKLYYVFDLGQADSCAMTCVYEDDRTAPTIFDYKIENRTALSEFTQYAKEQSADMGIPPSRVTIVLPFDSNQTFQGYNGEVNRFREVQSNMPSFNIELIGRTEKMRGVQVIRTVLETGQLRIHGYEVNEKLFETEKMKDWTKILASVEYKVEKKTNKIEYVIDKRSGVYGDHPLDSLRYVVVYLFRDMFKDDSIEIRNTENGFKNYSHLWEDKTETNIW